MKTPNTNFCTSCSYFFPNERNDKRTLNTGICIKKNMVKSSTSNCSFFQTEPITDHLKEIKVIEPKYVYPSNQLKMF